MRTMLDQSRRPTSPMLSSFLWDQSQPHKPHTACSALDYSDEPTVDACRFPKIYQRLPTCDRSFIVCSTVGNDMLYGGHTWFWFGFIVREDLA